MLCNGMRYKDASTAGRTAAGLPSPSHRDFLLRDRRRSGNRMFSAHSVVFSALILGAWQASAIQVVKRGSIAGLLPRQTSSSCTSICTTAETAISTCSNQTCLCTTANANSLQQCVNCFLEASSDETTLSNVQEIVGDFEVLCGSFPIPAVTINTAGGVSTPAGTSTTRSTTPTPPPNQTPKSSSTSPNVGTPTPLPGGSGTSSSSSIQVGGSAGTTAASDANPFPLPTTIAQITIGPSDVGGATATAPAASTTGPITFGGLTSGTSRGGVVNSVLLAVVGVVGVALLL